MLISLRNDHKDHLKILTLQPLQVLVDFCKLAIDFIHNGPNNKRYTVAAQKLEVEIETIRNCIYGLVNLLQLSCKHKLSEADFRDSILTLGFSHEQQSILSQLYESKQEEIQELLSVPVCEPHYENLKWRFEAQMPVLTEFHFFLTYMSTDLFKDERSIDHISPEKCEIFLLHLLLNLLVSSRALLQQAIPIVAMELELKTERDDKSGSKKEKILLQSDPNNLMHIANELEKALLESKSRYSRKIQRTLKN